MCWGELCKASIPENQATDAGQDRQHDEVARKRFNLTNLREHPKLRKHRDCFEVAASRPHDVEECPAVQIWVDHNCHDEATHQRVLNTQRK